jgi:hypothetical protein
MQAQPEFGWFLPTSGDTTCFGDRCKFIESSAELFDRVVLRQTVSTWLIASIVAPIDILAERAVLTWFLAFIISMKSTEL